jgi:hypothetical protein
MARGVESRAGLRPKGQLRMDTDFINALTNSWRWFLRCLDRPSVKFSAQCLYGLQTVHADVEGDFIAAPDPKPAVFPRRFALRPKCLALEVHRAFHRINPPMALLGGILALRGHLNGVLDIALHGFVRLAGSFLSNLVATSIPAIDPYA